MKFSENLAITRDQSQESEKYDGPAKMPSPESMKQLINNTLFAILPPFTMISEMDELSTAMLTTVIGMWEQEAGKASTTWEEKGDEV